MKIRLITHADYKRLKTIRGTTSIKSGKVDAIKQFYKELRVAVTYLPGHISSRVITMNSKVLIKDLKNGEEFQLTLTYPNDANEEDKKISVLHPIGMALFGRVERDEVTWKAQGELGSYQILRVLYQPDSVGDFHL